MKKLMLGNEAVARGAYEAGVSVVSSYPGTPSTEITENIVKYDDIYVEWAPNEKVAAEVAIGASIAGARSMSCMKHVGLNVMADPVFTASYTGVNGGLVLCVADDQGMHSSQNEQDSRHYAKASKILMLEPSDSGECKEFTKTAYELSEKYDTPVFLRLSTRVSHSQSLVEEEEKQEVALKDYEKNPQKYVMMPGNAIKRHVVVEDRINALKEMAETSPLNRVEENGSKIGIIAGGIAYMYAKEALGDVMDRVEEVNGVKLLALRCAGFNNVDLNAAANAGITVVRVPAYSPYAVAEYTVALMLSLNRKIPRASWRTKDGNFSLHGLMGFDMHGKTVGIIGTGKIAKILIHILKGFGMNVLAYDLYPDYNFAREEQIVYTSLDELYHSSDIISLHCPLTEATKYLINDYSISKMKDGVMIINTGRGQLIHTNALIEGLKNKKIGSAGLDVYEEESEYFYEDQSDRIIDDDVLARLLSFNNVIVTSHQAFFTREAMGNIAVTTLQNIKDFINHKPLLNEVKR